MIVTNNTHKFHVHVLGCCGCVRGMFERAYFAQNLSGCSFVNGY